MELGCIEEILLSNANLVININQNVNNRVKFNTLHVLGIYLGFTLLSLYN